MVAVLLLVLFIAVPIAELAIIIQVGGEIGVGPTVAILIADSVLGSLLMRAQGRAAWRRLNAALATGRPPAREVLDGALVMFGGALLLTPGFLTDLLGLALLLPPTRALVRRALARRLLVRMTGAMAGAVRFPGTARFPGSTPSAGTPRGTAGGDDVEGTATDLGAERLDRPR